MFFARGFCTVERENLEFSFSTDEVKWKGCGPILDMSLLSDHYVKGGSFTGAMVGVCCQDLSGKRIYADFDWFEYREN